ncbi:hypothetical protein AKJ16_DCAP27241 [Drosera capensis]
MASRGRDLEADIESGGTTSSDESTGDSISVHSAGKKIFNKLLTGPLSYDGPIKTEFADNLSWYNAGESIELLVKKSSGDEENGGSVVSLEKTVVKEKKKKPCSKKPSRPPRPPKGPSLNDSDIKIMKEISELAARKRARIERMKALRRMKAPKKSSSGSLTALVITAIFFLVIFVQGFCSKSSVKVGYHGSPEAAVGTEGLISVKFYGSPSNEINGPVSHSPSSAERAAGSIPFVDKGISDGFVIKSSS